MGFIFSSLGAGEILLVLVAVLLLFGAEKMPSIARTLGKTLNEMRRAAGDLTQSVMDRDLFSSSDRAPLKPDGRQVIDKAKRKG